MLRLGLVKLGAQEEGVAPKNISRTRIVMFIDNE